MDNFEKELIRSYHNSGLKPLVRYIDDIFLVWTHGDDELQKFLSFVDTTYSSVKNMKWEIKFEVNKSEKEFNFLDVTVKFENEVLSTQNLLMRIFTWIIRLAIHDSFFKNIPKAKG